MSKLTKPQFKQLVRLRMDIGGAQRPAYGVEHWTFAEWVEGIAHRCCGNSAAIIRITNSRHGYWPLIQAAYKEAQCQKS